jgi:hypothetical protein
MNTPVSESCLEHWKMYFDGSLNIDGVGHACTSSHHLGTS